MSDAKKCTIPVHTGPIDDIELFELMQKLYPGRFKEDEFESERFEDFILEEFEVGPEQLQEIIGKLLPAVPLQKQPLSGGLAHCLGRDVFEDCEPDKKGGQVRHLYFGAAVSRKALG